MTLTDPWATGHLATGGAAPGGTLNGPGPARTMRPGGDPAGPGAGSPDVLPGPGAGPVTLRPVDAGIGSGADVGAGSGPGSRPDRTPSVHGPDTVPTGQGPGAPASSGTPRPTSSTIGDYEELLLGGAPTLTSRDLAERTQTQRGRVDEFWLAMGFPAVGPDQVAFTERDLEIYRTWSELIDSGLIDLATARSLLRAQSHISDRLALWQVEALVEDSVRRLELDDTTARLVALDQMRGHVDLLAKSLVYTWQRQMESLLVRVDREVSQRGREQAKRRFPLTRSLGFVDMVSYTSSSTILGGRLVGLVERFEDASRSAVTEGGGRVVKMIGDAVFFIADDLTTGLRVVTSLIDRLGADDDILPVRASFVRGDVFSRSGDVFGPPVNLASRLVDVAPVGKILTDASTAAAIAAGKGGSGYELEDFPSAELRGFGTVSPYLLSRTYD